MDVFKYLHKQKAKEIKSHKFLMLSVFLVIESTGKCTYGPALETRNHLPSIRKDVQPQPEAPPFHAIPPQGKLPGTMHMEAMPPF